MILTMALLYSSSSPEFISIKKMTKIMTTTGIEII